MDNLPGTWMTVNSGTCVLSSSSSGRMNMVRTNSACQAVSVMTRTGSCRQRQRERRFRRLKTSRLDTEIHRVSTLATDLVLGIMPGADVHDVDGPVLHVGLRLAQEPLKVLLAHGLVAIAPGNVLLALGLADEVPKARQQGQGTQDIMGAE